MIGSEDENALQQELEVALAAAADAAGVLRDRAGRFSVREKARADLVTEVDEASERAIQAAIHAAYPSDAFIAEEFSAADHATGRRWVVDPLDGTVNYVHGHPFACVSIALLDDLGPRIGVIHAPFLGEVYHAIRGGGAYLNGMPIKVSSVTDHSATLLATGFPFKQGKGRVEVFFRLVAELVLSTHGVRRAGAAALDLAYVACGRVDGFFEVGLAPWDVAAGILLIQEAGGQVTGWPGDAEEPIRSGRVIATNGHVHEWLLDTAGRYVVDL